MMMVNSIIVIIGDGTIRGIGVFKVCTTVLGVVASTEEVTRSVLVKMVGGGRRVGGSVVPCGGVGWGKAVTSLSLSATDEEWCTLCSDGSSKVLLML